MFLAKLRNQLNRMLDLHISMYTELNLSEVIHESMISDACLKNLSSYVIQQTYMNCVSTKLFHRFFVYHHVGAHLKNFARERAATHLKNYLNIK